MMKPLFLPIVILAVAAVIIITGAQPQPAHSAVNLERLNSRLLQNVTVLEHDLLGDSDNIIAYVFVDPLCTWCGLYAELLREIDEESGIDISVRQVCAPTTPDAQVVCQGQENFTSDNALFQEYVSGNFTVPAYVFNGRYVRKMLPANLPAVEKFELKTVLCELNGFRDGMCRDLFGVGEVDMSKVDDSLLALMEGSEPVDVLVELNENQSYEEGFILVKRMADKNVTYKNILIGNIGLFSGLPEDIKNITGYDFVTNVYHTSGIIERLAKADGLEVQYFFSQADELNYSPLVREVCGNLSASLALFNIDEWSAGDRLLFQKAFEYTPAFGINGARVDVLGDPILDRVIAHGICSRMNLSNSANFENCRKYSTGTEAQVKLMMFTSNDCGICSRQVTTVLALRDNMSGKLDTYLVETSSTDAQELRLVNVYDVQYLPHFVINGYRSVVGTITLESLREEVCKEIEC